MRSRALAVVLTLLSLGAFAAAAFFVRVSEQHVTSTRAHVRVFDDGVRRGRTRVADFDAEGAGAALTALRSIAVTDAARTSIDAATSKMADVAEIAPVLADIDEAGAAENQAADRDEAEQRKVEAIAVAAAGGVGFIALAALALAWPRADSAQRASSTSVLPRADTAPSRLTPVVSTTDAGPSAYTTARSTGPVLRKTSELCTSLARVSDVEELQRLVGQAADVIDASGLILWVNVPTTMELHPALSHGYSNEMLSRLPPLPRAGDNAVARAFRSGQLQIVLARPGASNGALAAPLMTPTGCAGVFSAEIRGGGESSETVQALTAILAAQLATVLPGAPAATREPAAATGTGGI